MELQPDSNDPTATIITYETKREYDLVHPYRFRRAARQMLEATTILVEPLQFPLQWRVSNAALKLQQQRLYIARDYIDEGPSSQALEVELRGFCLQIGSHLRAIEQEAWPLYDR